MSVPNPPKWLPFPGEDTMLPDAPPGPVGWIRASHPPILSIEEWERIVRDQTSSRAVVRDWEEIFFYVMSTRTREYTGIVCHDAAVDDASANDLEDPDYAELRKFHDWRQLKLSKMLVALNFRLKEDLEYLEPLKKMRRIEWTHMFFWPWTGAAHPQPRPAERLPNLPEIDSEDMAVEFFMTHEWYDILDMLNKELSRRRNKHAVAYSPMWSLFGQLKLLMNYPTMEYLKMVMDMDLRLESDMLSNLCSTHPWITWQGQIPDYLH